MKRQQRDFDDSFSKKERLNESFSTIAAESSQQQYELIVATIVKKLENCQNRPETFDQLVSFLETISLQSIHVDVEIVFYQLLLNELIVVENGFCVWKPPVADQQFHIYLPLDSSPIAVSVYFLSAVRNLAAWCQTEMSQSVKLDAFLQIAEKFCVFETNFIPLEMATELCQRIIF
jgi:hypothetical protein